MSHAPLFSDRPKSLESLPVSFVMEGPPTGTQQPPAGQSSSQPADQPLRPNRTFMTLAELNQEMQTVWARAELIINTAREQNRGMNEQEMGESKRWIEYYDFLRDQERPRVEQWEKMVRDRAQTLPPHPGMVAQQGQQLPLADPRQGMAGGGFHQQERQVRPVPTRRLSTFRADLFGGNPEVALTAARDAGHWLRAYLYECGTSAIREQMHRPQESMAYCKDRDWLTLTRVDDYESQAQQMTQVVGTPGLGGFLVPEIVLATVIDVRDRHGLAPNITRRYPMSGETDLIPKRETGLTVEKPGEDNPIPQSTKTWAQIRLAAVDAYTLTAISAKLLRGSVVDAAEQVISEIGYAFAKQLDYEMIAADGTLGQPNFGKTGLINAVAAGGVMPGTGGGAGWASIQATDIDRLIGMLPDRFDRTGNQMTAENWATPEIPRWLMPRAFFYEFIEPMMEMRAGSKADVASTSPRFLRGYPIHFSEWMPRNRTAADAPVAAFGNFYEGIQLGEREAVSVSISEHNQFHLDNIVIKGKAAWDLNFHEPGDATNAGAIVLLKSAP